MSETDSKLEPKIHPDPQNKAKSKTHPNPQNEADAGTQSQSKKKKGAKKRIEIGVGIVWEKNEKVVNDDFIVTEEEYGHSDDEVFVVNFEEDFSVSKNSEVDENESENGSDDRVRDKLLSDCPNNSF